MAHVVPGLEDLAWEELFEQTSGTTRMATWSGFDRRASVLLFRSREPAAGLLDLRLTEDVFAVVSVLKSLPPGKAGLRAIARLTGDRDGLEAALLRHREVSSRRRRGRPTFRVVARKAGEHAFRRVDAQRACERALAQRFPRWRLVQDKAAMEFWLQITSEEAVLALRLSSAVMRQRSYRDDSLPGALKPTVAHALVRLAGTTADGLLLDPMCGSGTVLAEAASTGVMVLGGDRNRGAARAALQNLRGVASAGRIARWDAGCLPLPDRAVGGLACNLPWGKRHRVTDLEGLYRRFLTEARRVARADARIALLTSERDLIERIVRGQRNLVLERRMRVVVRGTDAWLLVLRSAV